MARLPRLVVPRQPHHVIQSGSGDQAIFSDPEDYTAFLGWLKEASRQFGVAIHAYVLMPTHVRLLATPSDATGLSRMMQWVGRYYVPYFNARYQRNGTLWQGRYKATVLEPVRYLLVCSRYIELAPLRTGLVADATNYRWSSIAHHVGSELNPLITDHPLFWALGNTPFDRELAYRAWIDQGTGRDELALLDEATGKGWPLGSDRFIDDLGRQLARRVTPARRGRPSKRAS